MALFIALPLPAAIRSLVQAIPLDIAGTKPENPADLHITLKHSIHADAATTHKLIDALNDIRAEPFTLEPLGLRTFTSRETGKPFILYLAIKPNDSLIALRRTIETACSTLNFAPNSDRYTPHITLSRLPADVSPNDVEAACTAPLTAEIPSWTADRFGLYDSPKHAPPGSAPRYRTVAEFQLTS